MSKLNEMKTELEVFRERIMKDNKVRSRADFVAGWEKPSQSWKDSSNAKRIPMIYNTLFLEYMYLHNFPKIVLITKCPSRPRGCDYRK